MSLGATVTFIFSPKNLMTWIQHSHSLVPPTLFVCTSIHECLIIDNVGNVSELSWNSKCSVAECFYSQISRIRVEINRSAEGGVK